MMFRTIVALLGFAVVVTNVHAAEHKMSSAETQVKLRTYIDSDARPEKQKARDKYRRPFETLTFCGIEPDMTIVEIWPGGQGGWYRRIIEPMISEGGGRYIPVLGRSAFPTEVEDLPHGDVDMVLVFRAHGFMIYDEPAQQHVDAVFSMLRPGGQLCIVDHAGDEYVPQDPTGENGYVNESHFKMLAEEAGFALIAASDHNRNSADTKDHPRGVWSLPPTLSRTIPGTPARKRFIKIGESDRFTHKYVKPSID